MRPTTEQLRRVARRTWHYFEQFVTAADHHLPPDNVQEAPDLRTAHRTSPTNIGMDLLSTLAAHDLGYVHRAAMAERVDATLGSVESLERHEGHLLNWYDTTNLAPLLPRYVSTVDSGNLAGALMALAAGLREFAESGEDHRAICAGAVDTAGVLGESLAALVQGTHAATPLRALCLLARQGLDALRTTLTSDLPPADRLELARVAGLTLDAALARVSEAAQGGPEAEAVAAWAERLQQSLAPAPDVRRRGHR